MPGPEDLRLLRALQLTNASRLARLFEADDFLERSWPGRHRVFHGPLERLGSLAELPPLEELLELYPDPIRVALPDKRDEHSSVKVDAQRAQLLHGEGLALILDQVERVLPPVRIWLDALRVELGLPLRCDPRSIVYASPAGAGNSAHFDANANFVVQLKGMKRWRIAPNTHVPNPTDRWAMNEAELSEELAGYVTGPLPTKLPADAETFELKPGSVLFVPRGYWHQTEAFEDTLALNFTFGQPTWADLALTTLRARLLEDPAWRELATGLVSLDPARAAVCEAKLVEMLARLPTEVTRLTTDEVVEAMDAQTTWLLAPRAFLRVEDEAVVASVGAGEFQIDAEAALFPLLEWIGRQRTPFSLEQAALHFPAAIDELAGLLAALTSQRVLDRHRGRPSPNRD